MVYRKLLFILLLCSQAFAQKTPADAVQSSKSIAVQAPAVAEQEVDTQAIVKETEYVEVRNNKMGVFWWIPTEFWEAAVRKQGFSDEVARKTFAPFRKYNVFMIAVGDLGLGNVSWAKEAEIKKNVAIRDQHGNGYKPVQEIPDDVKGIVDVMRPTLKNMMGSFGEGLQFVFFTAQDSKGVVFADPHKDSELSLDVTELMDSSTKTYVWRMPLSSLSPPKYCPVGKEKVEASWKYCPWHGNKLEVHADVQPAAR